MATVVLQNVTRQFGTKIVLDQANLELQTGQTTGLVGVNGAGKTTVFRLITGEIEPDLGTVTRTRGLEIGHLEQEPRLDSTRTLYEEVSDTFSDLRAIERRQHEIAEQIAAYHDDPRLPELMVEYDRLHARFEIGGGHNLDVRINEVLGGLGFSERDHELPVSALSGGQKCRAALGKLLLQGRRMLLLDEPTNHLDIEATRWLEKYLAGHHGGAVIISHDRYLLDRLADRIVEVENRKLVSYPGNYSAYVTEKDRRRLTQDRRYEQDQAFIRKERDFIARHKAGQRSKEARGRQGHLERRIAAGEYVLEKPTSRRQTKISFKAGQGGGEMVLRCENTAKRYGDKLLFEKLSFDVYRGDRLGITGPNGTGKTTLLRIVLGQVDQTEGDVRLYENLRVAYYDQEHSDLDRSGTVLDLVRAVQPGLTEHAARSFLARFLFSGDEVFKPIEKCSGGEQSRVRLARMILSEPQVLILDEPTNHLDIPAREALENALDDYDGTIVVVSHDRYFLDRVVGRLLVLERGAHRLLGGNYSLYAATLDQEKAKADAESAAARATKKKRKRKTAQVPASSQYDALTIERLEELIMDREARIGELNELFADEKTYRNPDASKRLQAELEAVRAELAEIELHWHNRVDHA